MSVCICFSAGKHTLACNRHELKCFLLQESTDRMHLGACLLRNTVISLVSEYQRNDFLRSTLLVW